MSRTILAVLASAVVAAACGNPSLTAPEDPARGGAGASFSATQTPTCAAQSIALSYTPVGGRHVITAQFLDGRGSRVHAAGCAWPVWSAAPAGAQVQPLFDGSREVVQAQLIVTGATQVYTVTAVSGTMSASVAVSAGR